uniref:Ccdc15 protein n=1 Tax=Xenopus tropicalis TaxID=8364 RepID=B1WAX9_XENTR|nr:ccdc15 protein [Xenopus tropicalis]
MSPPVSVVAEGKQRPNPTAAVRLKPSRLVVNQAVLAERNPSAIAPVGAWVECAANDRYECEGRAMVSAQLLGEQLLLHQKEKQERLKHFQGEVKRRVNQHARLKKKQQLQKSYDAIMREGFALKQSCEAAVLLSPKKNTCTYRNTKVAICSPRSHWVSAHKIHEEEEEEDDDENTNKLLKKHTHMLNKTMKHVRHRLAALKTVERDELTLPGGIWKVSPTRDNPVSRQSTVMHQTEEDIEELFLTGYHDLPVELLAHNSNAPLSEMGITETSKHLLKPPCSRLMKESYPTGPSPAFSTDYRAALVLRPGVDEEENRKQRQTQFLMYRRLFMDIEREQVKEMKRQKEHEKKILKVKREREFQRQIEEQQLLDEADLGKQYMHEKHSELSNLYHDTEKQTENEDKTHKNIEYVRYVEALRAQMKEKIQLHNIELPPLCCCGSDFWESHPDTCANNCVFYKNPKAYARALQSVISSREMWDGNLSSRFSTCSITSAHSRLYK